MGIIAFTGSHGTGKTTSVYEYCARLKKETRHEIGLITETARRCPFPIFSRDSQTSPEAQLWIFSEQTRCELDSTNQFETVVSDRTIVDCVGYTILAGFTGLAGSMLSMARHHIAIYEQVIFKPINSAFFIDDGLRNLDKSRQVELEQTLLNLYHVLGVNLIPCGGDL
jgi:predicted ATPase